MAARDIMPFSSPHGGTTRITPIRLGGGTTNSTTAETGWREGEIGLIDGAAGDVNLIPDGVETIDKTLHCIFLTASSGDIQLANLTSGATTHNHITSVCRFESGQEFITRNAVTSSDVLIAVSTLFVGDIVGGWRDNTAGAAGTAENGVFSIDSAGTGLVITRILDANFKDVGSPGAGAGIWVVFTVDD